MDDQDITPDQTEFRVETEFDAEPSEVWRVLTDPESMGEWLGSPVVVEEVDDERRLVFRWASTTEAPTVVELDLRPIGRRTHLSIVERPVHQGGLRQGKVIDMTARACVLARAV